MGHGGSSLSLGALHWSSGLHPKPPALLFAGSNLPSFPGSIHSQGTGSTFPRRDLNGSRN